MTKMSNFVNKVKSKIGYIIKKRYPRYQANKRYKVQFGRNIDWKNPTEFNEKLRWLQFKTDTSKWTLLADKYRVRKYLEKKGYGDMLVKLYGVWDKAEDIDFSILPDSFVIKTNHGCGEVYIVKDKGTEDLGKIRNSLKKDLSEPFGIETAEPHYFKIKPLVFAEELLVQDGDISSSLIDYKFYCINGEPIFCGVMFNRDISNHTYSVSLYDQNWKDMSAMLGEYSYSDKGMSIIPKPQKFKEMKQFCKEVCKEFPFVRMDLYECNGKLYFGEFTFTPAACTGGSLGEKACEILATKIQLPV